MHSFMVVVFFCSQLAGFATNAGGVTFVLAPVGLNGTTHATTCSHYGLAPTAFRYEDILWDQNELQKLSSSFGYTTVGKLGCCAQAAWCDKGTKKCFSTGFGQKGYDNIGWKGSIVNISRAAGIGFPVPVYSCEARPQGMNPIAQPNVDVATFAVGENTIVEVLGHNFGDDPTMMKVFVGDRACADINVCHTMCKSCTRSADCGGDEECFMKKSSNMMGVCLRLCEYDFKGNIKPCPCNTVCRKVWSESSLDYKKFCMGKGISMISEICETSLDPRLVGAVDSKISCSMSSLHPLCPSSSPSSLTSVFSSKALVSLSVRGKWSISTPGNIVSVDLKPCTQDSECSDDDACTVDKCVDILPPGGTSPTKCCDHLPSITCEVARVSSSPGTAPWSSDYMIWVDRHKNNISVVMNEVFGTPERPLDTIAAVKGFSKLSVSEVDDTPLSAAIDLGFSFPYHPMHRTIKKIWPSPNGAVQMIQKDQCGTSYMSYNCDFTNSYYDLIAPLVTDFNPSYTKNAQVLVKKRPRSADILFLEMPLYRVGGYDAKGPHYTFMNRLFADGTIQMFYVDVVLPVLHSGQLIGLRGPKGERKSDIFLRTDGVYGFGSGAIATFCPLATFACMTPTCGKPGTHISLELLRPLTCGDGTLLDLDTLKCSFDGMTTPATYLDYGNDYKIMCSVPKIWNNTDSNGATFLDPFRFSPDGFAVSVIVLDGRGHVLPFHSLDGTKVASANALTKAPLVFHVDRRDVFSGQCSKVENKSCNKCQIYGAHDLGKDCSGICFGDAIVDSCGTCTGGHTNIPINSAEDCAGVCHGTAALDICGTCAGGTTNKIAVQNRDECARICGNGVTLDDCGVCGGNNMHKDCDGICFGSNVECRHGSGGNDESEDGGDQTNPVISSSEDSQSRDIVMIIITGSILAVLIVINCTRSWRRVNAIVQEQEATARRRPRGVEPHELGQMRLIEFSGNDGHNSRYDGPCAICMSDYEFGETLRRLPCDHEYHRECIDAWFVGHRECPICKQDVGGREVLEVGIELVNLQTATNNLDRPLQQRNHGGVTIRRQRGSV